MLSLAVNIHRLNLNEKLSDFKWRTEEYRRFWRFSKHCQRLLYSRSLPNTHIITPEIQYFWQIYSAKRRHDKNFEKDLQSSLSSTLVKKFDRKNLRLKHILISEQLINLDRFFYLERKHFIDDTSRLIREQKELEIVCLEGLGLTRKEGYKLLSALISSEKALKFLYLWRLYKRHEFSLPCKKRTSATYINAYDVHFAQDHHWLKAIWYINNIQTLSLNYAYISSESGDILVSVARQLRENWRELQLLCLEDELPYSMNVEGKFNAVTIPDFAWNEAQKFSRHLKVHLVFLGILEYDKHKLYLTQSIPLQSMVLSTNVEILHHKPCFLDCTLKTLYLWYHRTLVELHLNFWNHRETIDNHLRKIFSCLPNLEKFSYLGVVRDPVTIFTMCCQIKLGNCATKKVDIKLQKPLSMKNESMWLSRLNCILESFKCDFERLGVIFEITVYPC